jgi:histidyl-tRNA synthetase
VLDTKNPAMQQIADNAPKLTDFLGPQSRAHFDGLQRILKANNIPFTVNPRLVRGLDYYNLTVFEWITDKLGAQGTVAAGGRYDPLIEQLGGKPTAACGWAMGIERLLELLKEEQLVPQDESCDVYVVHQGDAARDQAFIVAERLRDAGFDVILHCSADGQGASFKSQMKRADASGAAFAVILGEDEVAQGAASVKPLRAGASDAQGVRNEQQRVALADLTDHLINAMGACAAH